MSSCGAETHLLFTGHSTIDANKEAATNLRSQAAGEAAAGSRSGSSGSKNGDMHGTRDGIREEEV